MLFQDCNTELLEFTVLVTKTLQKPHLIYSVALHVNESSSAVTYINVNNNVTLNKSITYLNDEIVNNITFNTF